MTTSPEETLVAMRLTLFGRVQGIGLRPAIARLAQALDLHGWVKNSAQGLEIQIEGTPENAAQFRRVCAACVPPVGKLNKITCQTARPSGSSEFRVIKEDAAFDAAPLAAVVPFDLRTCPDCQQEFDNQTNPRYGYALLSCTQCGPRYSILHNMPYEREDTTLRAYPLCRACQREFDSPADRRFHAQTTACPNCGPQMDPLPAARTALQAGGIVALLGLGGYQLLADATSQEAVQLLRLKKGRLAKPLAVLVADLETVERLSWATPAHKKLLADPAGPIVLVPARLGSLAANVAPGLSTVGLMLATTPAHAWLARQVGPLVCTSGNAEGEPLEYEPASAVSALSGIAVKMVHHARPIRRPVDDSLVHLVCGRATPLRLARGLAPMPLALVQKGTAGGFCARPEPGAPGLPAILATGGQQKTALALWNGSQAVLGPHVGDLDSLAARARYESHVTDMLQLYRALPGVIAHDRHPDYFSSRFADTLANKRGACLFPVYHHHAHVAAGMLDHGWLAQEVLGVAWDGTGLGPDGTIWGGEFLRATATGFARVGHLRPFSLVGGEAAIRQPRRIAAELLRQTRAWDAGITLHLPGEQLLAPLAANPRLAPVTTSAGRLFDGVAALILPETLQPQDGASYEGQFAALLESACDETAPGAYPLPLAPLARDSQTAAHACGLTHQATNIAVHAQALVLDWRPLVAAVVQDLATGASVGAMAMRFHRGLAAGIASVCHAFATLPVVLTGGVFQNRILTENVARLLQDHPSPIGLPGQIPVNDGGLAAGQLAVAWATLAKDSACA